MRILEALLVELLERLRTPGPLYIVYIGEDMADNIRVKVLFPPVTDIDVETREFSYTVDGGAEVVEQLPKDVTDKEYVFAQDSDVSLSLVDIDDGGNRSPASTRTFKATDSVPPSQPGELGVEIIGEE